MDCQRARQRAMGPAAKPARVYRRAVEKLTRHRERAHDPTSRTLYFTFAGGLRARRSRVTFVDPEHVPPFEGEEAWFELELVAAKPWSQWRAVRQVAAPAGP